MPQMTELAIKDIKILITVSYGFRKLEEKILCKVEMEEIKDGPN